jgi:spoIIIJ-associated protein
MDDDEQRDRDREDDDDRDRAHEDAPERERDDLEAAELLPEAPADRVRAVVARVVEELEVEGSVAVEEDDEEIRAVVDGPDLGVLIGRHGSTIDALQDVASRAAYPGPPQHRKRIVVDAAGYRAKREEALHRQADRAVADALDFGRAVELEPMSPHERKVVHNYLAERADVETHSEGDEPQRRLVVTPVQAG